MTRRMIEITYNDAMRQASALDQYADEMLRVANNQVGNIKSDISVAWQGDSANAYLRKLDTAAGNIRQTAARLRDIASTLRSVATIFRNSELRAIEIAEQRSY